MTEIEFVAGKFQAFPAEDAKWTILNQRKAGRIQGKDGNYFQWKEKALRQQNSTGRTTSQISLNNDDSDNDDEHDAISVALLLFFPYTCICYI